MIEKVMKALTERDYLGLASCFSKDCVFFDYCPSQNGRPNSYVYGSECIELYYRKMFIAETFEVAEPVIESEKSANFFGSYAGPYVYARLSIEKFDDAGLIEKAIIHPA